MLDTVADLLQILDFDIFFYFDIFLSTNFAENMNVSGPSKKS